MNLGELRQYVRETLESDNDEFTDFMVDAWLREGWLEIHRYSDFPFMDTTWSLSTSLAVVDFGQIADPSGQTPKWIRSVRSPARELAWLQPDELQTRLANGLSGDPQHWAVRGGRTLMVSPAPNDVVNYVVQGTRKPLEWITTGTLAVPDLPEDLHVALGYYALARAYARLDDPNSTNHHIDLYNAVLDSVATDTNSSTFGGSMQIGGGHGIRDRDTTTSSRRGGFSDPAFTIQVADA